MKKIDIFIAVLVTLAWGGSYIAIKYTVIEIPGLLSIAIRFIITSAIFLPFIPKPKIHFGKIYSLALVMGVFYIGLLYYGLYLGINTSLTVIIAQLNIPLSIIIARFALKEHFTLSSIIGVSLALIGVLIIVGAPQTMGNPIAFIMLIFSACFGAIFNIQVRKLNTVSPLSLLCWSNLIAAPHLLLMSYFIEGNPFQLLEGTTYKLWLALAYSIIVTGAGIILWFRLLQTYPIHKIMPFHLLTPFFGILLSILFLGEFPSWPVLLGGAIILSGIAVTQTRILPLLTNKRF
ncbi:MAG: EamA family transporter [Rickettsiales bacterium]|jgi:O-acetylserine/cysteine efflux transporter|nr:EamA family transporter [Rickettsiales bacterium]